MRMKSTIFALVGAMLLLGCVGTAARKEALLPAMLLTWQSSIAESVELGGGDPAPMTDALKAGDVELILAQPWGTLRRQAMEGIEKLLADGEIGFNVMTIMQNEVAMFDRAMRVIAGKAKLVTRRIGISAGDVPTYTHLYPRSRYHAIR